MPRSIPREELYPNICVRDPYFALTDLVEVEPGVVSARVPVELPFGRELGPIVGAEAGRHLAILGLTAASRINPKGGRHYYLAHKALLQRRGDSGVAPLAATARARFEGKREAAATVELRAHDGAAVYSLTVHYHVLVAPVFERRFSADRRDTPAAEQTEAPGGDGAGRGNPYGVPPSLVEIEPPHRERATAVLDPLLAESCEGHFPLFPALPVAIVMTGLSNLAGSLLARRLGDDGLCYVVERADVRAENLAFAGQRVTFAVRYVEARGAAHEFHCRATNAAGASVGDMDLILSRARTGLSFGPTCAP